MNQLPNEVAMHLVRGFGSGSRQAPIPARVDCPECGAHMTYPDKAVHLDPPRKRVKCPVCDYRGFIRLKVVPRGMDASQVELDGPLHIPHSDSSSASSSS